MKNPNQRCTVCQDDFSYIGELDKNGNINKYPSFKLWNNLETSNSCLSCSDYEICAGGFCPLYHIKKNKPRCMKFKEDFKKLELLKFADLQKAYNLYIHK